MRASGRLAGFISKIGIVLGVAAAGAGTLVALPITASASQVSVWVSYADIERANPVNFPIPWDGSPNTVFEGCQASTTLCTFDSGAVRVVNTSASPLTVDAITIHVDTCDFTGWKPKMLAPGAELIVTQTGPYAMSGCTGPSPARMDPSDIGPNSTDYAGSCTPNGIKPVVDITINGTTSSYTDSGQVLNTGGFDTGTCRGNESTQWTPIGQAPCAGAVLTLTPPSQSLSVATTATVTATFTNSCGTPLSNVAVNFAIESGPNAGLTGSGTTDANGAATFSYTSAVTGTDTIGASITNSAGSINSTNTVTVTWLPFAPAGGAFVVGDNEDVSGAAVYWWGAQWWKNDLLSTGLAPASFKGFENGNATPACGQSWTTRPGNSSRPPKIVPANVDMAVIVASHIAKKGPVISGDIVDIVLVHTNAGYGPNPGHPGTGTIVGTLCGSTHASQNVSPTPAKHGASRAVASPAKSQGKPADAAQPAPLTAPRAIESSVQKPEAPGQIRKQLRRR